MLEPLPNSHRSTNQQLPFDFNKQTYPMSSSNDEVPPPLIRTQSGELLNSLTSVSSSSSSSATSSYFDDGPTLGDALLPSDFTHQTDEGLSEFGFPGILGDPFMDTSSYSMSHSSSMTFDLAPQQIQHTANPLPISSKSTSSSLSSSAISNPTPADSNLLPSFSSLYSLPTQHQQIQLQQQPQLQLQQQSQQQAARQTQQLPYPQQNSQQLFQQSPIPILPVLEAPFDSTSKQLQDERSRKRTRLDDVIEAATTSTSLSQISPNISQQHTPSFTPSNTFSILPSSSSSSTRSLVGSPATTAAAMTPVTTPQARMFALSPNMVNTNTNVNINSNTSPISSSSPTMSMTVRRGGRGRPPKSNKAKDDSDDDDANDGMTPAERESSKKMKHQMTDRVRRAKIKEGMEALRDLVFDPSINSSAATINSKTLDQATIVVKSVEIVRDLRDEITQLRDKLRDIQLRDSEERELARRQSVFLNTGNTTLPPNSSLMASDSPFVLQINRAVQEAYQASPLTGFMASLNAAGVSMWRVSLNSRLMEVNLVFEMISGFSNDQLVGHTPCEAPLHGTLSVMPASFLRLFASVEIVNNESTPQQLQPPSLPASSSSSSATSSPNTHPPSPASDTTDEDSQQQQQQSQPTSLATATSNAVRLTQQQLAMSDDDINSQLSPAFQASVAASTFSSAQAPLFSVSLSQLPPIPDAELTSFFPKYLGCGPSQQNQDPSSSSSSSPHSSSNGDSRNLPANTNTNGQPRPVGCYLVNHLAQLPSNHCLKLLSRHMTAYGDILESVTTLCLVRDSAGVPSYMLSLTTPDSRRLLRRSPSQAAK